MAVLAMHGKAAVDSKFERLFPLISGASTDDRNGVKKAVNWALRQIGKRNLSLNNQAIVLAREIKEYDSAAAGWIASDALRELSGTSVALRLKRRRNIS